jgi:UDP-GlcNAc3NAcA epimerase
VKIATIVGARPQFIKAAMLSREIARRRESGVAIEEDLIHTGQHFDANMSAIFFDQLEIPIPKHNLEVCGGAHGAMTGRMLERLEVVLTDEPPDWVVVYGDTNSTLAGALAAAKLHIPLAHVEAGMRSFNREMPEEVNRIVADQLASLCFAATDAAVRNLKNDGVRDDRLALVGDIMYDAMLFYREKAQRGSRILEELNLEPKSYALATIHRAENTDNVNRLRAIMRGLAAVAEETPVVLPMHPRTRKTLDVLENVPATSERLRFIDPVGYLDMIRLESEAAVIATDSGGVQKEAYFNRVPCVTLRDETEWVELVEIGANRLVGADAEAIVDGFREARSTTIEQADLYGDGRAAQHMLDRLLKAAT